MNPRIRYVLFLSMMMAGMGCSEKSSASAVAKTSLSAKDSAKVAPVSTAPAGAQTVRPDTVPPAAAPAPATPTPNSPLLESPNIQSGNFKVTGKGEEVSLPGLTITMPKDWKLDNSADSPRLANLVTPEGMDVGIFWFGPTAGGTADENVKRWDALFSPLDSREVVKDSIHNPRIVFGRWQGGFHGDMGKAKVDKPDATVLLTAIVQTPKGSVYFKAVGSVAQASAARGLMRTMIWGAKLAN